MTLQRVYKTGLFSAIVLPIVLIQLLSTELKKRDLRMLSLALPTPTYNNNTVEFNYSTIDDALKKSSISYYFSIPTKLDSFDVLKQTLVLLNSKNHSPKNDIGICVQLKNEATYSDFVRLLNLCLITKTKTYFLDSRTNRFYFFRKMEEEINPSKFVCGFSTDNLVLQISNISPLDKLLGYLNLSFFLDLDFASISVLIGYLFLVFLAFLNR